MSGWREIGNAVSVPSGRVLVTTREADGLASLNARLPISPVEIAFYDDGRWWFGSTQPGSPVSRLWFDPDLFMTLPQPGLPQPHSDDIEYKVNVISEGHVQQYGNVRYVEEPS